MLTRDGVEQVGEILDEIEDHAHFP